MGSKDSKIRAELIDAAADILWNEGYVALTAGNLAKKVNLKRQIVHYYFGTIEDLLVAVIQEIGGNIYSRFEESLESENPLRAIQEYTGLATSLNFEMMALSFRMENVRLELKRFITKYRQMASDILTSHLEYRGVTPTIAPVTAILLITSISQTLSAEKAIGTTAGHAQIKVLVEQWIEAYAETGNFPAPQKLRTP
jgi:AcrR family transcriptional regulator